MNVAHFDDAKAALEGGKHCLLEKVFYYSIAHSVSAHVSPQRSMRPNGESSQSWRRIRIYS